VTSKAKKIDLFNLDLEEEKYQLKKHIALDAKKYNRNNRNTDINLMMEHVINNRMGLNKKLKNNYNYSKEHDTQTESLENTKDTKDTYTLHKNNSAPDLLNRKNKIRTDLNKSLD